MKPSLQQQHEAFKKTMQSQAKVQKLTSHTTFASTSPSFSISSSTAGNRPANAHVHAIITYLKENDRPVSLEEIQTRFNVDLLSANREILEKILRNDLVSCDGKTLRYHAAFSIKSKTDIIDLFRRRNYLSGIDLFDLKQSNTKVEELVHDLARDQEIIIIRAKDDGPKIVFLNDYKVKKLVDDQFKRLWSGTIVPADDLELKEVIESAGMKAHTRTPQQNTLAAVASALAVDNRHKKAAPRKRFRKIKITNDYLEGIDLNIDPDTI